MNTEFETNDLPRASQSELDEPLTPEMIAETTGARAALVVRLVERGLLESINDAATENEQILLPRRAVLRLRQMQRLRRDLGVNFAGASVVLEMVERVAAMQHEIEQLRRRFGVE